MKFYLLYIFGELFCIRIDVRNKNLVGFLVELFMRKEEKLRSILSKIYVFELLV